ncbi:acylphosphatase [Limibacter armeniacum]|uniref:acylphosphatase n=1 Tax=Limibacter armeniacum TaxID=466084 RepID=UPI002FE62E35
MERHLNITVTGNVQGVAYRAYTQKKATELGLKGFVRNLEDGSVYLEIEGEQLPLAKMLSWCQKGSPTAKVTSMQVKMGPLKGYQQFDIDGMR